MSDQSERKPVVLVDGSSYLFRAFHALPPLTNRDGLPTGAIKGVSNMLRKLENDFPGAQLIVVFDASGDTFRNRMFPDYKANRPAMPEDLRVQIEPLHRLIEAMGLPLLVVADVEADDVIGTLASQAEDLGQPVIISTGDKDMAQLVNTRVSLINTMSDTRMDRQGVFDKFGVWPEQIVDYLALIGDKVDNIPGVPNCGPKTAAKWLATYSTLESVIEHANEIKGKVGENLRASADFLPMSKDLATIRCQLVLPARLDEISNRPPDTDTLCELLESFGFRGWLRELDNRPGTPDAALTGSDQSSAGANASSSKPVQKGSGSAEKAASGNATLSEAAFDFPPIDRARYPAITDLPTFEALLERLRKAPCFAIDTETTSLKYMQAQLVGISVCTEPGDAVYIPVGHNPMTLDTQLDPALVLNALRPLLEDPSRIKVGQHLKYDLHILGLAMARLAGTTPSDKPVEQEQAALSNSEDSSRTTATLNVQRIEDTMLMSWILDPGANRHDMDTLARKYLSYTPQAFNEIAGKGAKQLTFDQIDLETAKGYAAEDADVTLRLYRVLQARLAEQPTLDRLYRDLELPLVPVLTRMETNGALIDTDLLRQQSQQLAERMQALEQEAFALAGKNFNLGSTKQLQEIFYDQLGYEVLRKTPGGQPSTAEPVLVELAEKYELPRVLLEYRGLSKLKSTYTDKLPELVNPRTGRIHTSYNQTVASTGRLSSSDPNLQNIPVRTEEGRKIRHAFIAPPGHVLVSADYSQVELRIMAHLSEDQTLIRAFRDNLDVHQATAAEVFDVPLDQVSSEQRRRAKAINFGLIYGMSAFGLARQLRLEQSEARTYINRYFERYTGVRQYMDQIRELAREQGYVETLFGRRLYLADIRSGNRVRQQAAERLAINAPMQGSAADIIKRAMLSVDRWLADEEVPGRMIMQVHDELIVECPAQHAEAIADGLKSRMGGAAELAVPLVVDAGWGPNWEEAH